MRTQNDARGVCDDLLIKHGYAGGALGEDAGNYAVRVMAAIVDEANHRITEAIADLEHHRGGL